MRHSSGRPESKNANSSARIGHLHQIEATLLQFD
jgi:hypothetical protein